MHLGCQMSVSVLLKCGLTQTAKPTLLFDTMPSCVNCRRCHTKKAPIATAQIYLLLYGFNSTDLQGAVGHRGTHTGRQSS